MNSLQKDYYKVAQCIKSVKKEIQFEACKKLIDLFIDKNIRPIEWSFSGIERYNKVVKLSNELTNYLNHHKKLLCTTKKQC